MNNEARFAAVAALIGLAGSRDYRDRADAGSGLARFAEVADARKTLLDLVLDTDDTFVTRTTAEALLRRQDSVGFAVVAAALDRADANHADWIHSAVLAVFEVFGRDRDAAVRECAPLTRDADDHVRNGANQLIEMLAEINPVLVPTEND
ncbi:hypothetical protein [Micromonospora vulcania]|uniref:HEAT repeat domain-containing protein n=1 Tax=Micromonospora vulcania TaxID=1441873 RepID=A0ABW1H1H8_9ACTN